MTDKTWKAVERRVAEIVQAVYPGAERNPSSGAGQLTNADVRNVPVYLEVKHRKRVPFYAEFKRAREAARREGKPLVFVIHEKGSPTYLAVLELTDLLTIASEAVP